MKLGGWIAALLPLIAAVTASVFAQQLEPPALLIQFDNERNLAAKEHLLLTITTQGPGAGPSLLRLAQSTTNTDIGERTRGTQS